MKANDTLFGLNPNFIWDPQDLREVVDPDLLFVRERSVEQFMIDVVMDNWEEDTLNVYFTGNVQIASGGMACAITLDPLGATQVLVEHPWILMNDGGFNQPSGFQHLPSDVVGYHVIEHEMAHYLGRFNNDDFTTPPPTREYTADEHIDETTTPGRFLLSRFYPPAYPLILTGDYDEANTETKEIWDRIFSGNWNNP